jgi:hypothetical protein
MTLHVFNPEHDIALASNLSNFTAPHAGRQLRADLGFLPALWAEEGDIILVENVEYATKAWKRLRQRLVPMLGITCSNAWNNSFQRLEQLVPTLGITRVNPWGWDKAIKQELVRKGIPLSILPSDEHLDTIRQLSHRQTAAQLLPSLQMKGTVGEAFLCDSIQAVEQQLKVYQRIVLKAPWSSSGRGIRFIDEELNEYHRGWIHNLLKSQGGVMVEPYYCKVKDFGMEFESTDNGIRYLGLSLFHTTNGAYTGNILATEHVKRGLLSRYVSVDLIDCVKEKICNTLQLGNYRGPFGVDMMIVSGGLLHPCVEINLRRTMGHVALAISPVEDDVCKVMRIDYAGSYKLRIRKIYLK